MDHRQLCLAMMILQNTYYNHLLVGRRYVSTSTDPNLTGQMGLQYDLFLLTVVDLQCTSWVRSTQAVIEVVWYMIFAECDAVVVGDETGQAVSSLVRLLGGLDSWGFSRDVALSVSKREQ